MVGDFFSENAPDARVSELLRKPVQYRRAHEHFVWSARNVHGQKLVFADAEGLRFRGQDASAIHPRSGSHKLL
jgi:hypothetical protein